MEKVYLNSNHIQEIGKGNIPTATDFNEVWKHISLNGFIFNEFWIICEDSNIKYQVVIDKAIDFMPNVKIKKVWYDKNNLAHHLNINMPIYVYRMKYIEMINNDKADIDDNFKESLIPMMFMQYTIYALLHREVEIIDPEIRTSTTSTTSKKSHKKTRYSLTECIKKYQHKNKNKKYEYHVESFPRRGGIRHYKSGKVGTYSGSIVRPNKNKGNGTSNNEYTL